MGTIKIRNSFQGRGGSRILDDYWGEYLKFDNGSFEETEIGFVFKATNGREIKVEKDKIAEVTTDYIAYRGFNNEATNGPGSLMVIMPKNNKNTFIIEGSSPMFGSRTSGVFFLELEINQETKDISLERYLKKVELNGQQLTYLANAFIKELFPKPNASELFYTNSLNGNCILYFDTEFYKRLMGAIEKAYEDGLFSASNSGREWNNLRAALKCFLIEKDADKSILQPYALVY